MHLNLMFKLNSANDDSKLRTVITNKINDDVLCQMSPSNYMSNLFSQKSIFIIPLKSEQRRFMIV